LFRKLKVNSSAKFKSAIIEELQKLGICRIIIFAYNAKANGIVKRGH
jgi:hypothetical protein